MAIRLGEHVVYAEIRNEKWYSTFGIVVLADEEGDKHGPIRFELTGNCLDDMRGKCVRIFPNEDGPPPTPFDRHAIPRFHPHQVGPTGTMTTQGWVKVMPCSVEEFLKRSKLGEPPPTTWARRLYLEWYGPNGRVVIEMADPVVEVCTRAPENNDDEGEWEPLPNRAPHPDSDQYVAEAGPGIVVVGPGLESPIASDDVDALPGAEENAARDEEDPLYACRLIDDCIDNAVEVPLASLIGGIDELPPADALEESALEPLLKQILARMALAGAALHVCEHYSLRDCYRLLRDELLVEPSAFGELVGTGWTQNMMTHEYCKACDEEAERKFREEYPDK